VAVEIPLIIGLLAVLTVNTVEVGRYAFISRQVGAATQAAATAALAACDTAHVPATTECDDLTAAVARGAASTPLGGQVTVEGVTEGYYCALPSGVLTHVAPVSAKPADCSAVTGSGARPGLYLRVEASYAFSPLLGAPSIVDNFRSVIVRTAWMRMQ
jgi:hypothetical protein